MSKGSKRRPENRAAIESRWPFDRIDAAESIETAGKLMDLMAALKTGIRESHQDPITVQYHRDLQPGQP